MKPPPEWYNTDTGLIATYDVFESLNILLLSFFHYRLIATYDVFEFICFYVLKVQKSRLIATYDVFEFIEDVTMPKMKKMINSNIRCIWIHEGYNKIMGLWWLIATYDVFEFV